MFQPAGRIRPVVPVPSLLTSARPLENVDWRSGIAWSSICQRSFAFSLCPSDPRELADDQGVAHVAPFTIYTPIDCTITGDLDVEDLDATARELTEAHTPAAIAETLWMGSTSYVDGDLTMPTLRRVAQDVSGAGALDLDDAVAQLLVHYEQATGGLGGATIHLPSGLAVYALGGGGGGSRICWPEGNLYRGALGSVVVPGPGYPNGRSPAGIDGHGPLVDDSPETYAGNEDGTAWIYVSGPVEYAVDAVRVEPNDSGARSADFRLNRFRGWGERHAIVRFDTCAVFATEVVNPAPMPEVS